MHDSYRVVTLQNILTQVPIISVVILGFYVSWVRKARHPEVSSVTMWALGLILFAAVVLRLLPSLVVRQAAGNVEDVLWNMFLNAVLSNILTAIGLGLLLWAAFGWRATAGKHR